MRKRDADRCTFAIQVDANPDMKKTVLVTGAAGCVGSQLVDELLGAGFHVVAADRPGSLLPDPSPGSLDVQPVDLTDALAARSVAQGMDVVVNLAAIVDISMPFDRLAAINLHAVRYLYQGAAEGGASLFIHFSTGSLYEPAKQPIRETDPLCALNDYARTKLLSEDFVLSRDPNRGPAVNVIRPALIFGPRGRVLVSSLVTVAPLLLRFTGRGVRLRGGPRTNLVHSLDVARAVRFLIEHRQPHGEVFNVANDDPRAAGELVSMALEIGGMRLTRWSVPMPTWLMYCLRPFIDRAIIVGALNRVLAKRWDRIRTAEGLVADGVVPRFDRESLDYVTHDFVFDNSKLKALGFEYTYARLDNGWRQAIAWCCENRWIPALSQ